MGLRGAGKRKAIVPWELAVQNRVASSELADAAATMKFHIEIVRTDGARTEVLHRASVDEISRSGPKGQRPHLWRHDPIKGQRRSYFEQPERRTAWLESELGRYPRPMTRRRMLHG
jgi:hypothetical protein